MLRRALTEPLGRVEGSLQVQQMLMRTTHLNASRLQPCKKTEENHGFGAQAYVMIASLMIYTHHGAWGVENTEV